MSYYMHESDMRTMREAMDRFGGSFVCGFSVALMHADRENARRLLDAFPELVQRYGPGSDAFNSICNEPTDA